MEGELEQKSNMQNLHIAGSDKPVGFYSLDAIISVGYRVNSKRGTQFRIWATNTLLSVSISVDAARAAITNLREVIGIRDHGEALFGSEHGERPELHTCSILAVAGSTTGRGTTMPNRSLQFRADQEERRRVFSNTLRSFST